MTLDPDRPDSLPFAQLVDAAPDGIVVADQRGVIVLLARDPRHPDRRAVGRRPGQGHRPGPRARLLPDLTKPVKVAELLAVLEEILVEP